MDSNFSVSVMKNFTDTYKRYQNGDKYVRELECLRQQFPAILLDPQEGDLFVGRHRLPAIGFAAQEYGALGGLGYYINYDKITALRQNEHLLDSNRAILDDLTKFWETENTAYKVRAAYPEEMKEAFPSDHWTEDSGVAFPLYRMAGAMLDYKTLLTLGIDGLRQKVIRYVNRNQADDFYHALLGVLDVFRDVCHDYVDRLERIQNNGNPADPVSTKEMIQVLRNIAGHKPQTFREAIQLMFLYNTLSGSLNYGRIDLYLGPFLQDDLESGRITMSEAGSLFESLWRLMIARNTPTDGRVIVGGKGRENEPAADRVALLAIETSMKVRDILPQLTLRFYDGQNPDLMEKALESIAGGTTFPLLYNDDINIRAVHQAFNIPFIEAGQYVPFGCGEYVIEGRSFGTPSGVINLLKVLEVTLFNGLDLTGRCETGLKTGPFNAFRSFDAFFDAYKKQVAFFIKHLAAQEILEYQIAADEAPFLFMSLLYNHCIEQGKAIFDGGIQYLGGTVETYGNANTSDSLLAIRKLIFEERKITPNRLLKMLQNNFSGYDKERELLLAVSKYGNDDDPADDMYLQVHRHVCKAAQEMAPEVGLHTYLVVNINNSANTILGRKTAASADGRMAGTSMANGNAAAPGMDKNSITAYLKSIAKPEPGIHAGYVQNIKLTPDLFKIHFDKLKALLRSYFKMGGTQLMINVVRKADLLRALEDPDAFPNLIVRVGGFSARFIDLDRDVQLEIINRTTY